MVFLTKNYHSRRPLERAILYNYRGAFPSNTYYITVASCKSDKLETVKCCQNTTSEIFTDRTENMRKIVIL